MIEIEAIGRAEETMFDVGVYGGSLRGPPSRANVIGHVLVAGEGVSVVFVSAASAELDLRVDLPYGTPTDELCYQRSLIGKFDVASIVVDRPADRGRPPQYRAHDFIAIRRAWNPVGRCTRLRPHVLVTQFVAIVPRPAANVRAYAIRLRRKAIRSRGVERNGPGAERRIELLQHADRGIYEENPLDDLGGAEQVHLWHDRIAVAGPGIFQDRQRSKTIHLKTAACLFERKRGRDVRNKVALCVSAPIQIDVIVKCFLD